MYRGDTNQIFPYQFIIACAGKSVIGCVRTKETDTNCKELSSLAVMAKYRNKGIGIELMKRIIKKDMSRPLYLICFSEMRHFYSRHGFRIAKTDTLPTSMKKEYKRTKKIFADMGKEIIAMKLDLKTA